MTIILSVLVLGALIFVHELGHFLVAKLCRVGVVEFSIGFGKKIWQKKVAETNYALGIVPLGGYVRMFGDDPREITAADAAQAEGGQTLEVVDRSRWFLSKGIGPRLAIVAAGPAFNLIFAILLAMSSFYFYGKEVPIDSASIGDVIPDYPAAKAGIKEKDLITAVNGKPVKTWIEMAEAVSASAGQEIAIDISRPAKPAKGSAPAEAATTLQVKLSGIPDKAEMQVLEGASAKNSFRIGVLRDTKTEPATFLESVQMGFGSVWSITVITERGLRGMIMGAISPKNIAGPIYIFGEAARSAERGFRSLLHFMIFLSVSLAILNLLPIPVLDGGHILFFLIEGIFRKPLSLRTQEIATQFGMLILLLLMMFAVGNDILRLTQVH